MLVTNQQLDKLAAARVDFVNHGMLDPKMPQLPVAIQALVPMAGRENRNEDEIEEAELHPAAGPLGLAQVQMVTGNVTLAQTRSTSSFQSVSPFSLNFPVVRLYPQSLEALTVHIDQPRLPTLTCRFLFDQVNEHADITSNDVDIEDCPEITGKISVFHSAIASFFAPSDECGLHGMCQERIRSCPHWQGKGQC